MDVRQEDGIGRDIPNSSPLHADARPEPDVTPSKLGRLRLNVLPMGVASTETAGFENIKVDPEDIQLSLVTDRPQSNIDDLLDGKGVNRVIKNFLGFEFDFRDRRTMKREHYIREQLLKG